MLTGRGAEWKQVCDRAAHGRRQEQRSAIRGFFEREFSAYQIRDDDRKPDGVVTGYFEPEIRAAAATAALHLPGVRPAAKTCCSPTRASCRRGSGTVAARVEGRNVVVQTGLSTRDLGAPGLYALDLSNVTRDTLDRKVRLRIEGRQLLPYFTREEIETKGAPNAKVLAFVEQRHGLVRNADPGLGPHPAGRWRSHPRRLCRAERAAVPPDAGAGEIGQDRAARSRRAAARSNSSWTTATTKTTSTTATSSARAASRWRGRRSAARSWCRGGAPAAPVTGSGIKDPSYVFFKESDVPSAGGPVGAFGVPLSAGRSIAVDPRSTPLGYPVFVSTRTPGTAARRCSA